MPEIIAVILAGGKGQRMGSVLPKVLHPVCGRPMIEYPITAVTSAGAGKICIVTSKEKSNPVAQYLKNKPKVKLAYQSAPLGTAHAVQSATLHFKNFKGYVFILYGDAPLIRAETLKKFFAEVKKSDATLGFITADLENPTGYGRVFRQMGQVTRVVEEKELTSEEKQIKESNVGFYCVKADWLFKILKEFKPHPVTKEYYLTDIIEFAVNEGKKIVGFKGEDGSEFFGANDRNQLSSIEELMRKRFTHQWMASGVTFVDPKQVYLDADVTFGTETIVHPQVYLRGKTRIGKNCIIECGAVLTDMVVGDHVHINPYCVLESSTLEKDVQVGPFARIRPDSHVGAGARIGNFVELKKTRLGSKAKANHLTYLGDAHVGAETNVGCGTITCNYDGAKKHPTKIGKKVFVGSDVQFIAPVTVGDGAFIAAGSTITENVPSKSLAIARGRQVNKKNWIRKRTMDHGLGTIDRKHKKKGR
ncbi:MAG: bifunctional UDP-N-acetylglucosamine diphosphorylase/glucosamine-1-phosphate N-acetyltransferase GlmU [Deltaproteobacteria bacterium]|nr:bifunctional UDP-N-acetylglucosamine diphosphorylase/glucosamine-1-phosphate N-acetyltransferase GlmU [Deltaproteobacteria bacterium]